MALLRRNDEPLPGREYIMFHGTSEDASRGILRFGFKQSVDGMLGKGVYLSRDRDKAARYPLHLPACQKVVIEVSVKVGKVIKIDYQGHPYQRTWHDIGYDTAWVPPNCGMVPSGQEEDCVWDPNRIRIIRVHPGRFILDIFVILNLHTIIH